ncbi:MAG: HDOD domain-containing protein [Acidimicrobiia bacterium]
MKHSSRERLVVQPIIASKVIAMLASPSPDADLGRVVEADPALCAAVLRAANATHLGHARRIGSVRQAMVMLGSDVTTALAAARAADLAFDENPVLAPAWFWPHSLATAAAAASLARHGGTSVENAYTAGLLHDIGVLTGDGDADDDHAHRGADLLERWNIPEALVSAVRHHHDKPDAIIDLLDRLVQAAQTFAAEAGAGDGKTPLSVNEALRLSGVTGVRPSIIVGDVQRDLARLASLESW